MGGRVRRFLFPRYEDEFPAFRAEVERISVLGLRVIAAVCLGAPLVSVLVTVLVVPSAPIVMDLSEIAIGALILYLSFQKWISPYARGLGVLIGVLVGSIQTAGLLLAVDFLETVLQARPEQSLPSMRKIALERFSWDGIAARF